MYMVIPWCALSVNFSILCSLLYCLFCRRPASTLPLTRAMGVDPRVQQDAQEFGRYAAASQRDRSTLFRHPRDVNVDVPSWNGSCAAQAMSVDRFMPFGLPFVTPLPLPLVPASFCQASGIYLNITSPRTPMSACYVNSTCRQGVVCKPRCMDCV